MGENERKKRVKEGCNEWRKLQLGGGDVLICLKKLAVLTI